MTRQCWEAKQCGREIGGAKANELGVCPAATDEEHHGKNNGINAGRYCWQVEGTVCDGKTQGTLDDKDVYCADCEFFVDVVREQGNEFEW